MHLPDPDHLFGRRSDIWQSYRVPGRPFGPPSTRFRQHPRGFQPPRQPPSSALSFPTDPNLNHRRQRTLRRHDAEPENSDEIGDRFEAPASSIPSNPIASNATVLAVLPSASQDNSDDSQSPGNVAPTNFMKPTTLVSLKG